MTETKKRVTQDIFLPITPTSEEHYKEIEDRAIDLLLAVENYVDRPWWNITHYHRMVKAAHTLSKMWIRARTIPKPQPGRFVVYDTVKDMRDTLILSGSNDAVAEFDQRVKGGEITSQPVSRPMGFEDHSSHPRYEEVGTND